MISLLLAASLVCTPNLVDYNPQPVLLWDHDMSITVGYRTYWRDPGVLPLTWHLASDLPIWLYTPCLGCTDSVLMRRGAEEPLGLPWPMQRGTDAQGIILEWTVRAYNEAGESSDGLMLDGTYLRFCMPFLCTAPGPCN